MYSPTLGRFISTDPIGFNAGDQNLYRYVGNKPTSVTDPTGLAGEEQVLAAAINYYRALGYDFDRAKALADDVVRANQGRPLEINQEIARRYNEWARNAQDARATRLRLTDLREASRADQEAARRAAASAAAAEAARVRQVALGRLAGRGGLAGGLIYLAAQDSGPPVPGARRIDRINEGAETVEIWELPDGTQVRRAIDVNGRMSDTPLTGKR